MVAGIVALAMSAGATATTYTVRRGDTLSEIARRHGVGTVPLARANQLRDPGRIYAGQVLVIPPAAPAAPAQHVVAPGETLAGIAARYRLTVDALATANGLTNPNLLYAGVRLRLPAVAADEQPALPAVSGSGFHVVARGDTLADIAARHGASVAALANANKLRNPNLIREGARLVIPGPSWRCPLPGARFINDWGFPRHGGRFHDGNDLFAPRGTPVLAPVAGVVEQSSGTLGGRQVWLRGADGFDYLASHLERFASVGRVTAGTTIGFVGTSGNAAGSSPHVHFEIHPRGKRAVNPYPVLAAACR